MRTATNDYTIRPNTQTQRKQTDLWDVVKARHYLVTTAQSQEAAQITADQLNNDPCALERGQTFADRGGMTNHDKG